MEDMMLLKEKQEKKNRTEGRLQHFKKMLNGGKRKRKQEPDAR